MDDNSFAERRQDGGDEMHHVAADFRHVRGIDEESVVCVQRCESFERYVLIREAA